MKKRVVVAGIAGIAALTICVSWAFASGTARVATETSESGNTSFTLAEAFTLALKRSETLLIQKEMIEEARGRMYSSLNLVLPSVSFEMTRFDQDTQGVSGSGSDIDGSLQRPSTPLKRFVFSQPLFSGFKEFAALAGSKADRLEQQFLYQRAKEMLFINVVEACYTLAQVRKDIEILETVRKLLDERMRDLGERVRLGRSRESELQMAKSDFKLAEAEIAASRRAECVAEELLSFYTGRVVRGRLFDEGVSNLEISDEAYYLSMRKLRSDVQASEQNYILYQKKLMSARSGFLPTVSLNGNYYTQRVGFQSGTDWDTTLKVEVPIFDGAETIGAVKQSASQVEQARLLWQETERRAETEIRTQYAIYQYSLSAEEAFRGAKEASEENHRLQSEDYRRSLVNNLEVLDALRRNQEISRRWNQAYYDAKKNYWRLKVSAGEVL